MGTTTQTTRSGRRTWRWAIPAAVAAAVLAGCGSSTKPASASGGDAETLGTRTGDHGTYLTADDGRSVYLWDGDSTGRSLCTGGCASLWPPVTTEGAPRAEGGAKAADLGTIKRSDGTTQVTYRGHPLYYYVPDTKAGQVTGQGIDSFGARWWLVAPSGSAVTQTGSGGGSGGSSPSSGYGY